MTVGLRDKMRSMVGGVSPELMQNGILARGEVLDVQMTGMSVSRGDQVATEKQVCNVTLNVIMDNTPPFQATVKQGIPVLILPQFMSGQAVVAVRVNPANHQEVAIDFNNEPPTVTLAAGGPNTGSAAELLALGTPARAVIIQSQPLGVRNQASVDMYALMVTILCDGTPPYQTQMGNPVPPGGVPLLYPGSNLPAKVRPGQQGQCIIDWEAALAEVTKGVPAG
jgi:hypothetical protein